MMVVKYYSKYTDIIIQVYIVIDNIVRLAGRGLSLIVCAL